MKKTIIYCDMDGVLADFNGEKNAIERFKTEKHFFRKLKPIIENVEAIKTLINKGYKVAILTTSPSKRADHDKKMWLKKYLPEIKNIIYGRPSEKKIDLINKTTLHTILFDDYGKNIKEWLAGGGKEAIKISPNYSIKDYMRI